TDAAAGGGAVGQRAAQGLGAAGLAGDVQQQIAVVIDRAAIGEGQVVVGAIAGDIDRVAGGIAQRTAAAVERAARLVEGDRVGAASGGRHAGELKVHPG